MLVYLAREAVRKGLAINPHAKLSLMSSKVSSYDYRAHLRVHDTTNVLPNVLGHRLALAEDTSALLRQK